MWLGDVLHNHTDLEMLDLHHTKIGDDDAIALAEGLKNNDNLRRLGAAAAQPPYTRVRARDAACAAPGCSQRCTTTRSRMWGARR